MFWIPRNSLSFLVAGLIAPAMATSTWIRVNQLGWHPDGLQRATILSDSDLVGKPWSLTGPTGQMVASGAMPDKLSGKASHNPKAYGAVLDFAVVDTGTYQLEVPGAQAQSIRVARDGYSFLAAQALRHLRLMRSGPDQSLFRNPSHLGDSACPVLIPSGPRASGQWQPDPSGRKLDMVGGWYDAGDQIKFTLTTAYTTYFLLRAWESNPGIQAKWLSTSRWPDLLDEAAHGLAYLEKTLVDDSTFVVEVGDGLDHSQGARLPESDNLDGKRPALTALSPMPMATTGAALALGARIFAGQGDTALARRCEAVARRIFRIVTQPGATRETAYWKDGVNDFYRDDTPYDNLALFAAELHALTGEAEHLRMAKSWSDSAGVPTSAGWSEMGLHAAARLSALHAPAAAQAKTSIAYGSTWAHANAPLWGIPEDPTWCPILGWSAFGAEAAERARTNPDTSASRMGWDVFDYVLGRNNWGVSFFMSPDIRSSAANIFGPIYSLNDEFPTGAIAEGPGSRATHDELSKWFAVGPAEPTEPFNTNTTVFYDNAGDFQTMETVIGDQATFLFLLAELTRSVRDTQPGPVPPAAKSLDTIAPRTPVQIPLTRGGWSVFSDQGEKGISTAELLSVSDTSARAAFQLALGTELGYAYAGLDQTLGTKARALDWSRARSIRLRLDVPRGKTFRVQILSSLVKNYDHFGKTLAGKGDTLYEFPFDKLAQRGFDQAGMLGALAPSTITGIELLFDQPGGPIEIGAGRAWALMDPSTGLAHPGRTPSPAWCRAVSGAIRWNLETPIAGELYLVDALGHSNHILSGLIPARGAAAVPPGWRSGWVVLRTRGTMFKQAIGLLR